VSFAARSSEVSRAQLNYEIDGTVLSLDVMDISGEHQLDLKHEIVKSRLDKSGKVVGVIKDGRKSTGSHSL
jgi:hypothetical protein